MSALVLLAWLAAGPAPVSGQTLTLSVQGDCPRGAAVMAALQPLVADGVELRAVPGDALADGIAQVTDTGDRYTLVLGDATKAVDDPARDCQERAQVAAVFIALNQAPAPHDPAPREAPDPKEAPVTAAGPEPTEDVAWGLAAFAGVGTHGAGLPATGGAGVGVFVQHGALRADLELGMWAAVEVGEVPEVMAAEAPRARLTRVPLSLELSYLLGGGALRIGPVAGLQLDGLSLHAPGALAPQNALRVGPAARLGVRLQVALAAGVHVSLRVGGQLAWPRYRLSLEPDVDLGKTPIAFGFALLGAGVTLP